MVTCLPLGDVVWPPQSVSQFPFRGVNRFPSLARRPFAGSARCRFWRTWPGLRGGLGCAGPEIEWRGVLRAGRFWAPSLFFCFGLCVCVCLLVLFGLFVGVGCHPTWGRGEGRVTPSWMDCCSIWRARRGYGDRCMHPSGVMTVGDTGVARSWRFEEVDGSEMVRPSGLVSFNGVVLGQFLAFCPLPRGSSSSDLAGTVLHPTRPLLPACYPNRGLPGFTTTHLTHTPPPPRSDREPTLTAK